MKVRTISARVDKIEYEFDERDIKTALIKWLGDTRPKDFNTDWDVDITDNGIIVHLVLERVSNEKEEASHG